mmetsp:Transcript_29776/g.72553  ORF Transcript_29776/g.72553 Transcript_29776/m.72553 type:complete len:213 (+) Transcript_29776:1454-2092(+)
MISPVGCRPHLLARPVLFLQQILEHKRECALARRDREDAAAMVVETDGKLPDPEDDVLGPERRRAALALGGETTPLLPLLPLLHASKYRPFDRLQAIRRGCRPLLLQRIDTASFWSPPSWPSSVSSGNFMSFAAVDGGLSAHVPAVAPAAAAVPASSSVPGRNSVELLLLLSSVLARGASIDVDVDVDRGADHEDGAGASLDNLSCDLACPF